MKILIITDIHARYKQPYWNGIQKLFTEYLIPKYKDYTIIHIGDLYEKSTPYSVVRSKMTQLLLNFKEVHTILGNHDFSRQKGSGIAELENHRSIHIYEDISEVNIQGLKCLMIPFSYNYNKFIEYQEKYGEYDLVFLHWTPKEYKFGREYFNTKNLKVNTGIFWGHIHISKDYNENKNNNYIVGTPQPTKEGEQNFEPRIFLIEDNKLREEKLPIYMTIKDIDYGDEIENKDYLYNIKDAPSLKSVYEKYKGFYIRDDGISIKLDEDNDIINRIQDINNNIKETFLKYSKEKNIEKNIENCCLEFL